MKNAPQQQAPKLPAHLEALAKKIEASNKKHGFTDFSKIDRSKCDDFHPIHAMVR
jgi:hypothetical protein